MRTDYLPGEGLAVVADRTAVLLPDGCAADVLDQLWASVRSGGGLTDHLQVLLGAGLAAAPAFAVVHLTDDLAHVVARGATQVSVVTAEGTREIAAAHVATWSEQAVPGALSVRLTGAAAAGGDALPVEAAVVRAAAVLVDVATHAEAPAVGIASPGAPRPEPTPAPVLAPVPVGTGSAAPAPAPEPVAATSAVDAADQAEASEVPEVSGPVLRAPVTVPDPTPTAAAADEAPDPEDEVLAAVPAWAPVLTGAEHAPVVGPRETAPAGAPHAEPPATDPAREPVAEPVVVPDHEPVAEPAVEPQAEVGPDPRRGLPEDHDGLTVLSSDMVALRRQLPEWAGDAVPQLAVPTPRNPAPAKLLMSTGLVVSLNRPVLLGRAPQVTRVANNEIPRLITVASPNQDISRTHAEVRMDGEDVVVTDLRSTNGVLLLRQGQGAQRLHPGEPTVVEPGVVVDLGEGVTFLVEAGG